MKRLLKFSWIGPLLFVGSIVLFGFLNPGYSHINQFISELGALGAPNALLMNWLGIITFGLSILLFSIAGFSLSKSILLQKIAFTILLIVGLLFIVAGLFNCNEGCEFANMTQEAMIHNMSAFSAFILSVFAEFFLGFLSFTKNKNKFYFYCLLTGILGGALFYVIGKAGIYSDFRGLYQRLFLLNFVVWLIVTGIYVSNSFKNSQDGLSNET